MEKLTKKEPNQYIVGSDSEWFLYFCGVRIKNNRSEKDDAFVVKKDWNLPSEFDYAKENDVELFISGSGE